jgi:hypothetical protein
MNFDSRYWVFIATAMFCATIASATTLYMATIQEHFTECNSVSSACFLQFGMGPCMALGILVLPPVMITIPYILRQNESLGVLSVIVLGCIVAYTAIDAVNNVAALMGYSQTYLIVHSVLDNANNVTGTLVGTGESLC